MVKFSLWLSIFLCIFWDLIDDGFGLNFAGGVTLYDLSIIFLWMAVVHDQSNTKSGSQSVLIFGFMILGYLVYTYLLNESSGTFSGLMRFLQYFLRFSAFFALASLLMRNNERIEIVFRIWRVGVIAVIAIGLIQLSLILSGFDLGILGYTRFRGGFLPQMTGPFYEPAALGQFLVASLFILCFPFYRITRNRNSFVLCVIGIVLSQSLGAISGFIVYLIAGLVDLTIVRKKQRLKGLSLIGISVIALFILGFLVPDHRVSRGVIGGQVFVVTETGSAGTRLWNEIETGFEFLGNETLISRFIGLGDAEARYFRSTLGHSDTVAGNGIVEILLRYGVLYIVFMCGFLIFFLRKMRNISIFILFLLIISQIDGAIAKPWIWCYSGIFFAFLTNRIPAERKRSMPGYVLADRPRLAD